MKTIKTLLMAALLCTAGSASADGYAYLTVNQSGAETSFEVSAIDKITFDEQDMILHLSNGSEQRMALSTLSKMFFAETGSSGISALTMNKARIEMEGGTLKVQAADGERVTLYNAKGQAVMAATGSTELGVGNLPKGVYIIKVGAESKKILNR